MAGLNVLLLVVGYCLLSPALRGRGLAACASYAGVALLVGSGLTGVALCVLAVAGATTGPLTLALVAAALAGSGLAGSRLEPLRRRLAPGRPTGSARSLERPWQDAVATAACAVLVAVCGFALAGAFRSSPWLDDTWFFWLPKGVALGTRGLDLRLWGSAPPYLHFTSPDYPLWWSSLTGLDLRFVGAIDLRAVTGQLTILAVAFVAALGRLLWGLVRPWLLWPGLLLVVCAPEFFRQAQGGGADLPVACYVVLFAVAAAVWLLRGEGLMLYAAFAFAAAALAIKNEGAPETLLLAVLLGAVGFRAGGRRLVYLGTAVAAAFALAAPWLAWRQIHGIQAEVSASRFFDVSYLFDRTSRIRPTVDALRTHLFRPREWLVDVPLALALAVLCTLRARRPLYLTPVLLLAAGFAFLVWVYWADPLELGYRLSTSSYRVVDTVTLLAAASIPALAEGLARGRDQSR